MQLINRLFGHIPNTEAAFAAIAIALLLAWVCAAIGVALLRKALTRANGGATAQSSATRATVRLVRGVLFLALTFVFVAPTLELFGEPLRRGLRLSRLVDWALDQGLRVVLILVVAYVVTRLVTLAAARFEAHLAAATGADATERVKRARTLSRLIRSTANTFIIAVALLEVLDTVGVNIAPILTGAGIVGLAVGFGAQTLVKDVISGFFLIMENQVRVGDVAEINGTGGLVEAINLRTIVLRDMRGAVHLFPCGSVNTLTNLTKDYSYAVLDLRVDYRYDTDKVVDLITTVAAELANSSPLGPVVLEPLEVMGVETLGDNGVTIRTRLKTVPQQQWNVGRELRRRLKKACEANGIELALGPQRFLVVPESSPVPAEPPR